METNPMKNYLKLVLAGAALIGMALTSAAHAYHKSVVHDARGEMVCTERGDCVRTMWETDTDECTHVAHDAFAVFFDFGSAALNSKAQNEVSALANSLKAKGDALVGVRIVGFADRIGNASANEKLSKRRADAVRRFLVTKGVKNAKVLETRWFGNSVATASCSANMKKSALIKCLQPDRRVEIEIDYTK
jgi:outer membrane protein OmpA-like peptidoglycan-associated protein